MAYSQRIFENMPIYAQLADEAGVLQHVCDSIQPEFDTVVRWVDQQESLYNPDLTSYRFLIWLGQFVGLAAIGDRWQGLGIDPNMPEFHQRRMIKEHWEYLGLKGTEAGIRKSLDLWLQYEAYQNRDRLQIRLPFGKTPTSSPPNWWSWGTRYDAHLLQAYPERQHLGGNDTPGSLYMPNWKQIESTPDPWRFGQPWNEYALEGKERVPIPGKGSMLGPERPWMHIVLTEATWNNVLPDIFPLNQESWRVHAVPTVFAWLNFPGPADAETDGGIIEKTEINIVLEEDIKTPRHYTQEELWLDGHQWGQPYPYEARNPTQVTETGLCEDEWGFPGAQFTDPIGGICVDEACVEYSSPGTPYYVEWGVKSYVCERTRTLDDGIECRQGIAADVIIGYEQFLIPGNPAIPPSQWIFVSTDDGAMTLEDGLGFLVEDSRTECLEAIAILNEDGSVLTLNQPDDDDGAEPVIFLLDGPICRDILEHPPYLMALDGSDIVTESDSLILFEGCRPAGAILLNDCTELLAESGDNAPILTSDDDYHCFEQCNSILSPILDSDGVGIEAESDGLPWLTESSLDYAFSCGEDSETLIAPILDQDGFDLMSETDETLPILSERSQIYEEVWDGLIGGGRYSPCSGALLFGEEPLLTELGQVMIEEGDSPYVCVGCSEVFLNEDDSQLLTEDDEVLELEELVFDACPCPGMNLVLLEEVCVLQEPIAIATYYDRFNQSPPYYFWGTEATPDRYEEQPIVKQINLCNTFDRWSTAQITEYRKTVIEIPEEDVDLFAVYPKLQKVSNANNWTLLVGTEQEIFSIKPTVIFWTKPSDNYDGMPKKRDRGLSFSTVQGLTQLYLEFVTEFHQNRRIQYLSLIVDGQVIKHTDFEALLNAPQEGCYGFRFRINLKEPAQASGNSVSGRDSGRSPR